jgi:CheY-like chemotaxis protein
MIRSSAPVCEPKAMTSAFPVFQPHDGDTPADGTPAQPRLLVIEDDAPPRMVIVKLARNLGYATREAGTIAEAAELIATEKFNCMTLDLRMGGHYGTELLETMSRHQAGVPVIVVSSADDDERWEVLRVATLFGIRVAEVAKPLGVARLRAIFEEIHDLA